MTTGDCASLCPPHHDDTGDDYAAHRMQQAEWEACWLTPRRETLEGVLLGQYQRYARAQGLRLSQALSAQESAQWLRDQEA